MAASVKNIKIGPSPEWMRKRLREAGIRPINNIVDITNFVMIETGQPMHAFDAADIEGARIIVRRAAAGEKLTTLDEKERELTESMLVICDGSRPIGLAGIMGGENSEIKDSTRNIIFESACFMYGNIRQTSRALGIATESSLRFSKGVTPQLAEFALKRALNLVSALNCGEIENGLIDICSADLSEKTVEAPVLYVNKLLGTVLSGEEMCRYLNRVSVRTEVKNHVLHCVIPPFRSDIFGKADIAEEVARMYGYDNIKATELPGTSGVALPAAEQVREKIRTYLGLAGFYECVTYSFAGPADYEKIGLPVPESIVIRNPLGDDTSLMRTTLVPDMLNVVSNNLAKKNMKLRLYETGKHYFPNSCGDINAPVIEHPVLMMAVCGAGEDFFTLKGEAENIISIVTGKNMKCRRTEVPYLHPGKSAEITVGDTVVGIMGEVSVETAEKFGISARTARVYIAEIRIDILMDITEIANIRYKTLPRFPASERDIAVIVDENSGAGDVLDSIIKAGGKKLENAELFDVYRSEQLGHGKKSLAYKLVFRADDRTLTDADTDAVFGKVLRTLETEFGAKLR